jgi:hypothetical protein
MMIRTIKNALADALALLDREIVHCRWRWLCVLPGMLWSVELDDE